MMMRRNNNRAKTRLMDLPTETLIDILKRLPVKSVCCIRCVSKTLSDIVYSPFFVDLHTRFLIPTNSLAAGTSPQLVLRLAASNIVIPRRKLTVLESLKNDYSKGELTTHNASDVILCTSHKEYYSTVPFVFYDLICYKHGYDRDGNCFLINPLCGEVLRIPISNILYTKIGKELGFIFDRYGMGFDDITHTYKIIRVSRVYKRPFYSESLVAQLLVLGTSSWREISMPSVPCCANFYATKSVCAYGDMHWLFTEEGDPAGRVQIVSFDFKKEEFYFTPIPVASHMPNLHLIALGESIAIVDTTHSSSGIEIWLMKDYNTKEWNREHIITRQMLGLDVVDFEFYWANCGEMEYGIYFIDQKGAKLLFVDLRLPSIKCVTYPISKEWKGCQRIINLKRSLISLKKFGNLVQDPNISEGGQSLLRFGKKYLWQD
ncbi:hypothetical protein ACLB2K_037178 [Fragaria x ananassa]